MLGGFLVCGSVGIDVDLGGCTSFRVGIEFREVANLLGRMREMRTSMSVCLHRALACFVEKRDLLLCLCYRSAMSVS